MSILCCASRSRQDTLSIASSRNPDGKEVFMDDLVLHPNRIDAKLESRIAEWENAMNEYQAFEDICREEIDVELAPILEQLRERPKLFKDKKYSVNVQTLAAKLIKVQDLQARLETATRDDDSSSLGARLKYYLCCARSGTRKTESETNLRDTVAISHNMSMSDKLSQRWALRLNEIDPTQGSLQRSSTSIKAAAAAAATNQPIKIKPKWPDFLIDTYFDVIKINMYGRKMRRIIKLTQHYVVNITNGEEISKFYAYREIRRVWLESNNTIVVVLKNGKQSVYMSHIAPHVLQQITTRVQVRRSLDQAEFNGPAYNLGYSAAVTAGIIKSISEENTLDSEAVVALFASELKDRTVRSIAGANGPAEGSNGVHSNRSSINTLPSLAELPEEHLRGSADEEESGGAANPLHDPQASEPVVNASANPLPGTKDVPSAAKKIEIVPPMPNFSSPFTNSIQNANELPLDRKDTQNTQNTDNSDNSFHTADSSVPVSPLSFPSSKTALTPPAAPAVAPASAAPRLLSFKEGMPEFYVQSAVQTLIFDSTTSEGNTRKLFIDRFKSACIASIAGAGSRSSLPQGTMMSKTKSIKVATLVEVRHFIDGMHEYILGNRGVSLSLLYEREKQRSIILSASPLNLPPSATTTSSGQGGGGGGEFSPSLSESSMSISDRSTGVVPSSSPGGRGLGRSNSKRGLLTRGKSVDKSNTDFKTFQGPNTTAVVDNELTSRASLQFLKDNNLDLSMIDEKVVVFISFIIFMVVEEAIFLPLKADLINLLPSSFKLEEEQQLLEKMKALSPRTQQQWGIPEDLISPLGWQTAIFELQGLEHNLTPSTQLHVLTRTVKAIYNEFKHVILPQQQARGAGQSCIAADDLVPIFIYVFCRSNLKHPMRSRDLMWSLCHPDQLQGEGGYYLTVFESSIEFVLNEEVARDSFAYNYATPATSAADDANLLYVQGLRHSHLGAPKDRTSTGKRIGSNSSTGSSSAAAAGTGTGTGTGGGGLVGTPFDISSDFHDPGLSQSARNSGVGLGWGSSRNSSSSHGSSGSSGHSPSKQQAGRQPSNSVSNIGEAFRNTIGGRDSIMGTLAQRLTLSNLLTRKPAPDNTTRESFN